MPTGVPHHAWKGARWEDVYARCRSAAPEAFEPDRVRNLWSGEWQLAGKPAGATSPVDGGPIAGPPMLELGQAFEAVAAAAAEHRRWAKVDLDERRARVARCVEQLEAHRELLALLLVWEIGKPWRQALTSVDRTASGVRWYLDEIEPMVAGRGPLAGPVSNIASWNYPLSVLVHAMLVQLLAGNAVIAKTPTDGGLCALTLATAFLRRCDLPVTLLSGSGSRLSPALVLSDDIGCLAFVGGRDAGGQIASQLVQTDKRHMLEQEGLNAWGVWEFSGWDGLARHLKKGFEYGKQRCTAYPRYVVQRSLFDRFLAMYLQVARSLTFGHPLAVVDPDDEPPELDFGPLINAAKVAELTQEVDLAVQMGGVPLFRGSLDDGWFLPGQDTSAYLPPVALLEPPGASALGHAEPFGPVDTIVLVDSRAELLAEMNASNGSLVASVACDDEQLARQLAAEVHAFKVGINVPRSRGDKAEPFGGRGSSWKGAFVGGEHLVHAVTQGPPGERLYGNFPDYQRYPTV
ncbi:MAG TPA: aldehyde dehydrogenase family protein [Actinomycetes bacterium]|jgi:acyl-CoA reductase-like NAD-dependent aldehyde dehydrogenase|nr:aldehyde dehydrogenase family protein [Actinomycetes bacterium]